MVVVSGVSQLCIRKEFWAFLWGKQPLCKVRMFVRIQEDIRDLGVILALFIPYITDGS